MTDADAELAAWLRNGDMRQENIDNPYLKPSRGPGKTAVTVQQVDKRPKRQHKYNAQPTEIDGIRFDSKREAQRYLILKARTAAGEIDDLQLQPRFELQPAFVDKDGKKHRAINYVADFQYFDSATGTLVVEEVKGHETAVWRMKYKMFLYLYPKMELRIIK